MRSLLPLLLPPLLHISTTSALRVTPGSPCEHRCGDNLRNTTVDDIVCRDSKFTDTDAGAKFQDCVECELESDYFVTETGESDVEWGLYNLRFAFSVCIYGVPKEVQSLSTPCQVNCQDLEQSITYNIESPSGFTTYDFCGLSSFPDDVVTKCAFCYSLTDDEKYMSNFIEALREGCHSKVPQGSPFILDPTRIFNEDLIPPNTASIAADGSSDDGGGKPDNLILIIVLPIVGFLILLACLGVGCFFLIRRRRRKAKRNSQSDHLHERWNDTSIMTPMSPAMSHAWNGFDQQQPLQSPHPAAGYPLPGSPRSFSSNGHNFGHSFYQSGYPQSPVDVKHPSAVYMDGTQPMSPMVGQYQQQQQQQQQQHQYQPEQFQYLQQQEQQYQQQQTQPQPQPQQRHQQASVPVQQTSSVPVLSDPPPPRKSLSKPDEAQG